MDIINPPERTRDPVMLTWFRFVRVIKKITNIMDKPIETINLSRYQFDLLMQVTFEPGINQKTCAERMNVTKGNITQHLDKLETQGLIKRNKAGRESSLHLTRQGKKLVNDFLPVHDTRVKEILSVLSMDEVSQLQSILRKLDRSIE